MNSRISVIPVFALASTSIFLVACANLKITHVPPHQSLNVALARPAELVRPAPAPVLTHGPSGPVVEPDLPGNSTVERVAEAYSRGEFCLGVGKDDEAIAAFEEAVKIDPVFTEAWQQLAMLYEKKGEAKKAIEAFRRSKKVAQQQH
jgi:tetratricopeptide (TPR) repeat protein